MTVVLVFSVVLVMGVLLSGFAKRSILSTAVLFLIAGFIAGGDVLGWVPIAPDDMLVERFAELALFSILYTDGLHLGASKLVRNWRLPGRALMIGLPVTVVLVALLARWITGVAWADAWLLGAALSPTDPVFAAALVRSRTVPERLRHLLNVESGLNDGLALPLVIAALALQSGEGVSAWSAAGDAVLGAAMGVGIAWLIVKASRSAAFFQIAEDYAPIGAFAIALLVLSATSVAHANEFLGAFAAGVTVSRCAPRAPEVFEPLGRPIAEILKLAAVLLFGALLSVRIFTEFGVRDYLFAVLTMLVARPVSIALAMLGARLSRREKLVAGWFGPKGFATVFFGFLILHAGIPHAGRVFALLALVVVLSIVVHSSSDVIVARRFEKKQKG